MKKEKEYIFTMINNALENHRKVLEDNKQFFEV